MKKVWLKLQKCVPRSCENGGYVCTIKGAKNEGNCIPKNYCQGKSSQGYKYKYDPNTCECKITCPNADEKGYANNGNTYTSFTDGKPNNPLICGKVCLQNNGYQNGGKGWCLPDSLCGESINEKGINLSPDNSCFPNHN